MSSYGVFVDGQYHVLTRVYLNIYDLDQRPVNDENTKENTRHVQTITDIESIDVRSSITSTGRYHTGLQILGVEYSYANERGIFELPPRVAPFGKFIMQIQMGSYQGGQREVDDAIQQLQKHDGFGRNEYDEIHNNCNAFTDALCYKLIQQHIPENINKLANTPADSGCDII